MAKPKDTRKRTRMEQSRAHHKPRIVIPILFLSIFECFSSWFSDALGDPIVFARLVSSLRLLPIPIIMHMFGARRVAFFVQGPADHDAHDDRATDASTSPSTSPFAGRHSGPVRS